MIESNTCQEHTEAKNDLTARGDGEMITSWTELREGPNFGPRPGIRCRIKNPTIRKVRLKIRIASAMDENFTSTEQYSDKGHSRGR